MIDIRIDEMKEQIMSEIDGQKLDESLMNLERIRLPFEEFTMSLKTDFLEDFRFFAKFNKTDEGIQIETYQFNKKKEFRMPMFRTCFKTREDKIILPYNEELKSYFIDAKSNKKLDNAYKIDGEKLDIDSLYMTDLSFVYMALSCLSIINCKNVSIKKIDPNENLNSKAKRKIKRGIRPPEDIYHIIDIKPFGKRNSITGGATDGSKMKFHTCRGHFKTYTEKNKLFGKYTGTYWIPPHAKGNLESGKITKNYNLKGE